MTQENKKNSITQKVAEKTLMWNMSGLKAMTEEESKEWHKKHSYVNEEGNTVITTEDLSKLLFKDLCARLPHGVIVEDRNGTHKLTIGNTEFTDLFYGKCNIKPYLRPISSMTEEEMDMLFDILHIDKDGNDEDWIKINDVHGIKFFFPTGKYVEDVAEAYDYLYSIHIDFRRLIHMGLAIEVTEENNPYKD